jgi:hypothetical protein
VTPWPASILLCCIYTVYRLERKSLAQRASDCLRNRAAATQSSFHVDVVSSLFNDNRHESPQSMGETRFRSSDESYDMTKPQPEGRTMCVWLTSLRLCTSSVSVGSGILAEWRSGRCRPSQRLERCTRSPHPYAFFSTATAATSARLC